MNQELKLQDFGRSRVQDFVMINYPQIYSEFLKTNNASHSLFVGSNHFSMNQKILGENILGFSDFLRYLRFVMILRIILRRKVTKRSDANLGREEITVLELDQSFLRGVLIKGLTLKKHTF